MINLKHAKIALISSGILIYAMGAFLIIKRVVFDTFDNAAISLANIIIIPSIGLIPFAAAIILHLEKVKSKENVKLLKSLAYYWIGFAMISCIIVIVLNILF